MKKAEGEHEKWAQCLMLCKHFIAFTIETKHKEELACTSGFW